MEPVEQTATPILSLNDLDYITNTLDRSFTRFNNEYSLMAKSSLEEKRFGNAVAFKDKNHPTSNYYNRVIGLSEGDEARLDEILTWFKKSNLHFTVSLPPHLQSPTLVSALYQKGFQLSEPDCLFAAIPNEANEPNFRQVKKITKNNLSILLKLMKQSGTNVLPTQVKKSEKVIVGSRFDFYVVIIDGIAVARASIFFHRKTAWLSNAVTLPEFRGLGCQGMLLKTRLNAAFNRGCSLALTDTHFGTTSHRNILRSGFHLCYMTAEFTW